MGGRGQVQVPVQLADFMAVFQVTAAEGSLDPEITVVNEQFIAGGDIDMVAVKGDAAQSAVPATSGEVDIGGIPVHHLVHFLAGKIHQVNSPVAFSL